MLDVPATQVRAEPDCAVQLIVDPVLIVLLEHRGAMLPAAVQLPVELLLDTLEPELVLLVLEAHVVMVLLPDVATVHPGGASSVLGVLPEPLELDDPLLLKVDDPPLLELDDPPPLKLEDPPLLELDDPPPLKLDDPPLLELDDPPLLELEELRPLELDESLLELAELLLVEPDELSLVDTELSCARATCANEAWPGLAGSAVAPATSSTATGRAIRRADKSFIRSFVRILTVEPFLESVRML